MRKNPKKMNKKLVMLTSIFIVALFIGTNCSTATTVDSFSNSIEKESKVEAEKTAALSIKEEETRREVSAESIKPVIKEESETKAEKNAALSSRDEESSAETVESSIEKESEPDTSSLSAESDKESISEAVKSAAPKEKVENCPYCAELAKKSEETEENEIIAMFNSISKMSEKELTERIEALRGIKNFYVYGYKEMSDVEKGYFIDSVLDSKGISVENSLSLRAYAAILKGEESANSLDSESNNLNTVANIPDAKIMARAAVTTVHSSSTSISAYSSQQSSGNDDCDEGSCFDQLGQNGGFDDFLDALGTNLDQFYDENGIFDFDLLSDYWDNLNVIEKGLILAALGATFLGDVIDILDSWNPAGSWGPIDMMLSWLALLQNCLQNIMDKCPPRRQSLELAISSLSISVNPSSSAPSTSQQSANQ